MSSIQNSNCQSEKKKDPKHSCIDDGPVKIGDIINDTYLVVRELNWGSFSTVWLCWDQHNKRFVAVKVMRSEFDCSKSEQEIRFLKFIRNNNIDDSPKLKIVQLLDDFKLSSINGIHNCLVFEVMGENLYEMIEKSNFYGLPLPNVKSIIKQVLQTLNTLHTQCGVIHADIKPENIRICVDNDYIRKLISKTTFESLLPTDGPTLRRKPKPNPAYEVCDVSVKIANFKNSCWIDYHFTDFIQTYQYRSPEVILGAGYGPSADIWSVACMAFQLATGDYLFNPIATDSYTRAEDHLVCMMELLGEIPIQIARSGIYSQAIFSGSGKIRHIQLKPYKLLKLLMDKYSINEYVAKEFVDFLLPMLAFDPVKRSTAQNCVDHPWLNCCN